jgi:glycosidase
MEIVQVDWDPLARFLNRWRAVIPACSDGTTVRYRVAGWATDAQTDSAPDVFAMDGQGFWFRYEGEKGISTFAYQVESNPVKHPAWMDEAIIYHIFLDRFHPGTPDGKFKEGSGPKDIHGGTLKGVLQSLPYLSDLGVNCLWLSPIGVADTYHRYDGKDYFTVDPGLGSNEDLRALTDAAHKVGMRVLLDFVPCHCSYKHPAFLEAQKSTDAPTYSWFTFYEWPHKYRSFLDFVPWLPSLNTNDPGVRQHLIESAVYWMRECGIDGFRLDHSIGHGMDFWVQFKKALLEHNPGVVTIGEATDTPDSLRRLRGRLDDILDFPLAGALRRTFAARDWSLGKLDNFLESYDVYMQQGPGRVSFLDNHDMERFLYVAQDNVERLKLAALCQFSLEQTPVVYYGTEIGLSHENSFAEKGLGGDTEARKDMIWDPWQWDQDLLRFYRQLIQLRRQNPVLLRGFRRCVHLGERAGTYAYVRSSVDDAFPAPGDIYVVFNLGDKTQTVPLPSGTNLHLLLATDTALELDGSHVSLAPDTGAWLGVHQEKSA